MKLPILALLGAAIVLQTGCVTGRRSLSLPVPTHAASSATRGQVYIASVTDNRQFQNKPSDPSVPSIDGDVTKLSTQEKDRMIGRQRNTWGKAMGDIGLKDNDSVTKRVRLLVEEGLRRKGYGISVDPKAPVAAAVTVDEFWGWGTPGFWALTFEAKIQCTISVISAGGAQKSIVKGYGINHGQVAKDVNWQEAFDPAFEDFITNFGARWDAMVAGSSDVNGALLPRLAGKQ
jgi:uncharacterized lipoprotein YajG